MSGLGARGPVALNGRNLSSHVPLAPVAPPVALSNGAQAAGEEPGPPMRAEPQAGLVRG
jgi:hypothetical protein